VILPKRNERDLDDIPDEVRHAMQFVLVERIDEAIEAAFDLEQNDNYAVPCGSDDPFISDATPVHANCQGENAGFVQ
jgi:ATP-dependent Lon protease